MQRRRGGWMAIVILATIWMTAVVAWYFVAHKPFAPALALSALKRILDLGVAAAIVMAAGGLGRRVFPGIHPSPLACLAFQGSFGLGVLALAVLGAGMVGGLYPWVGWAALAGLWIGLRRSILEWCRAWRELGQLLCRSPGWIRALGVLSALILGAALGEALAPAAHFDALVYHLTLPQAFLDQHSVAYQGLGPYWGMPLGGEMLYTWAIALHGPECAAVLGWMAGALALIGVVGLGAGFGRGAGWAAAAVLISGKTLASSLGWAYSDWFAGLHAIAALIAVDAWVSNPTRSRSAAAGSAAAFAFGVKYTGGLALMACGVGMLPVVIRHRRWSGLALYVLAGGMLALPWLVKNAVFTGAPLFPFAGAAELIDPLRPDFYRGEPPGLSLTILATPALAVIQGVEGAPGTSASLGPLLLALLPGLCAVNRRLRARMLPLALFLLTGWGMWVAGAALSFKLVQSRLYYALIVPWAVAAGAGFAGLARIRVRGVRIRRLAEALVLLVLALAAIETAVEAANTRPFAAAFGLESPSAYLGRRLGVFGPAMQAVRELGHDSRVQYLWEPRSLYCRPICSPDLWLDRWYVAMRRHGDAPAILDAWRAEGITHVLLYRAGQAFVMEDDPRYSPEDWAQLGHLLSQLRLVARFGESYELYQVPE